MTDRHRDGLSNVITAFSVTQDPWCIIAGAATALHTGDWSDVHDIDVIVSVADARRLIAGADFVDRTDGGNDVYRSVIYASRPGPVDIDIFGDFEIYAGGRWTSVTPTPIALDTPAGTVFIPGVQEQLAITRMLGRPKDSPRIARLEQLLAT